MKKQIVKRIAAYVISGSFFFTGISADIQVLAGELDTETIVAEQEDDLTDGIDNTTDTTTSELLSSQDIDNVAEDEDMVVDTSETGENTSDSKSKNDEDTGIDITDTETTDISIQTQAFHAETSVDGFTITVDADAGVLPNDCSLKVRKVGTAIEKEVETVINDIRNQNKNIAASYTFDISLYDTQGNEIEPDTNNGKVRLTFDADLVANDNLQTDVYHVDDGSGNNAEKLNLVDETDSSVTVETDGFSYYTVEFTYGKLQYVLQGDKSVALTDILDAVGIKGKITNAQGSNDSLFSVKKKKGEWVVEAKRAFSSEEWLRVTVEGIEYQIIVTDDADYTVKDNWYLNYNHELDEENRLIKLTKYKGSETDVYVPATATIDNVEYHTVLCGTFNIDRDIDLNPINSATGVTSVTLEEGIIAGDNKIFIKCAELREISGLSGLDTSKLTSMSSMFDECKSLEQIDISSFDTSNVTDMS